jgi:diketogulonate reductase-like aldo/keto reductase
MAFLDDTVAAIVDCYDKRLAQVVLRRLVYQEHVVAIRKATRREYLAANAAVFAVESTAEEIQEVAYAAPACRRGCPLSNRR